MKQKEVMCSKEQIRNLHSIMETYKVPFDILDLEALIDKTLSYEENKSIILPLIETLATGEKTQIEKVETDKKVKKLTIKGEKEAIARVELEGLKKEAEFSEKEFEKSIKEIKENKSEILENLYKIPREYIKSVITGDTISLILLGKQARGKSYLTIETLNNGKVKFKYFSGFTSPLALYKLLYENREVNTINVFDDTQGLMANKEALPIMLNALYSITPKREIMWNTTSGKLGSVPTRFVYEAKTILITNALPKNINSTLIFSRCLPFEFNPSNKELLIMMYEIAKQQSDIPKENRLEIVDFIKDYADGTCKNFDLRTQKHIENLYRYDKVNWKELATPLLSRDKELVLLKILLKECLTIAEAERKYCERVGCCRKTFYNRKKEIEV
jgi:hypothetical protein